MTREEYERRKRRLEAQLEEGIELLRAGFRQQVRALELVWMTTAEEDGILAAGAAVGGRGEQPALPSKLSREPQPVESSLPRLKPGQLWDDVEAVFADLPPVFDRHDLLKALGYEPERSSLHRVIRGLLKAGDIVLKATAAGRIAAKYEKTDADEEIAGPNSEEPGEPRLPAS